MLVGNEASQIRLLECLDFGQVAHQRLRSLAIQAVTVHRHLVQVGDFLIHRTELVLRFAQLQEHVTQTVLIFLGKHIEHAIAGILGMFAQRVGLHPAATGILIEIVARLNAQVHVGAVHAMCNLCLHTRHGSHHNGHC